MRGMIHQYVYCAMVCAGDTFNAGMIHSFLSNHNEQQAINYACQLAGHKCGHPGLTLSQLEFN